MKLRLAWTAAFLLCLTATAFAADLGPLQFLLSKEETAAWKSVKTDQEAKDFIDLFWAKRDPSPGTPANEYRDQIEMRIRYADDQFNKERVRGAMTDRGRTLIVFGEPSRVERVAAAKGPNTEMNADLQRDQNLPEAIQQWTYESPGTRDIFGNVRVQIRFVDRSGGDEDYVLEPSRLDMKKARERAIALAVKQPQLTTVPVYAAPPAPVAVQTSPAAQAAPVVVTELTTDAFKTAITAAKAAQSPYAGKGYATWGEYVTSYGETFVPVGVYVTKSAGLTAGDATFFGVVEDSTGKSVLAFEEPVKPAATKEDFFVDKSLTLPAGKYHGTFGVAQNGKVVAVAGSDLELTGSLDKSATAISQLILSNNIYPLSAAQGPSDPFAFGGLKVVPKADRTFRPTDELWYFFELRNPGMAEPPLPEGTVAVNPVAPSEQLPKVQVKLDVAGKETSGKPVKMTAPPRETDAIPLKGVPGHYGVGNAIPLSGFKAGEYTFTVKVIDIVKKASYTLTDHFRIVE